MTKAEMIERFGIEYYEEFKKRTSIRNNIRQKEQRMNNSEFRTLCSKRSHESKMKRYHNDNDFHTYLNNYHYTDTTMVGTNKHEVRQQSQRILFKQRKHTKLKDYQIHHCFGYEDPSRFIYIPRSLHTKIHQYLRDNNINADTDHYKYISTMINECTEYTYISA